MPLCRNHAETLKTRTCLYPSRNNILDYISLIRNKSHTKQDLEKVGVYGYVNDAVSAESVLANNPDSGTDAGQFAMIENVSTNDKKIEFEFIAAVPKEKVRSTSNLQTLYF